MLCLFWGVGVVEVGWKLFVMAWRVDYLQEGVLKYG